MLFADFLLIDIGNTAVKLRPATRTRLAGKTRRIPTAELVGANGERWLTKEIADWNYGSVVLSSVVPEATRQVVAALRGVEVKGVDAKTDAGVDLRGYPGVKTLGADRIANMAGAWASYKPGPLIVVDFGTAATFNALDAKGKFMGGTIAPGLRIVAEGLTARTAQLPTVRLNGTWPQAIGRNTPGALRAGALIGYRGLVREILEALRTELGGVARVVATGGDARFLAQRSPAIFDVVDSELTLEGLRVIGAKAER